MANPEHFKIVKAGKEAVNNWNERYRIYDNGEYLDLSNADLAGINLDGADVANANFVGTNLQGAKLSFSCSEYAQFHEANMMGAILNGGNFTLANFTNANIEKVDLRWAEMEGAIFSGANLKEANLSESTVIDAEFINTDLCGVNLSFTNLAFANLNKARLDGIVLFGTTTDGCSVIKATCKHFFLSGKRIPKEGDLNYRDIENYFIEWDKFRDEVIKIKVADFNKSKTFNLLEKILADYSRTGVVCDYRLFRGLKENLNSKSYHHISQLLKYKNGKALLRVPAGRIIITPKKQKK